MSIKNDLSIYENHADEWWDSKSYFFGTLKRITPFRLSIIRSCLGEIEGKRILDIGCGGGLIAIPLLDEGADVMGIDISQKSVEQAKLRAQGRGEFLTKDARHIDLADNEFDHIILADVVDHIPEYRDVLKKVAKGLKVGGRLFVGTINRTFASKIFAIFIGEGCGYIPKGTHDWSLFITPRELTSCGHTLGLKRINLIGERPEFIRSLMSGSLSLKVTPYCGLAYSVCFEKV